MAMRALELAVFEVAKIKGCEYGWVGGGEVEELLWHLSAAMVAALLEVGIGNTLWKAQKYQFGVRNL